MHWVLDKNTGLMALEPWKWLRSIDKARLLNLLWVLHYNCTPITMVVIKQLLCLVHDGFLCLEEPIPITDMVIHKITRLPYTRENLAMEFGKKAGEYVLAEAMKEKLKLVKKLRDYVISSIYEPTVKVVTQLLEGKVMRKGRVDEVSAPVIYLLAQCTEGVQFNLEHYLCREFLVNYREAKDLSKSFHYAWL